MSKNTFSVKATMYPKQRRKDIDGPWKPTIEDAVKAFAESLKKKDLDTSLVFRAFVAERCSEAEAPAQDNRGNYYKSNPAPTLFSMLSDAGVRIHSVA